MRELQLTRLECSLYALRHRGASSDFLLRRRPLAEVKQRGRWLSDASLRRYQKSAVAQREVLKMTRAAQAAAISVEKNLQQVLESPVFAFRRVEALMM